MRLDNGLLRLDFDENQLDVLAEAFAVGSFLAIATRDMTGRLSEAPALARRVADLARLRRETAVFVSHGRFIDDRSLELRGGKGYLYESPRGLAVALANGPSSAPLEVRVRADSLRRSCSEALLHAEGEKPIALSPRRREGVLGFRVRLAPWSAGVLTLEGEDRPARSPS